MNFIYSDGNYKDFSAYINFSIKSDEQYFPKIDVDVKLGIDKNCIMELWMPLLQFLFRLGCTFFKSTFVSDPKKAA